MRKRLAILVGVGVLLILIGLLALVSLDDPRQGYERDRHRIERYTTTNDIPRLLKRLCYESAPAPWRMSLADKLSRWPKPISSFAETIREPGLRRQRLALLGFEVLGPEAAAAAPRLAVLLLNTNMPQTAGCAAMALAHIGCEGLPALTNALSTPDPRLRLEVLWALGNSSAFRASPAALSLLTDCMKDPDPTIGGFAIQALIVGRPDAAQFVPILTNALCSPRAGDRRSALDAFAYGYRVEAKAVTPVIRALLNDPNAKVRAAASNALAGVETPAPAKTVTR
jgi:HEAT repeat protein